jgi:hypothetical protein
MEQQTFALYLACDILIFAMADRLVAELNRNTSRKIRKYTIKYVDNGRCRRKACVARKGAFIA